MHMAGDGSNIANCSRVGMGAEADSGEDGWITPGSEGTLFSLQSSVFSLQSSATSLNASFAGCWWARAMLQHHFGRHRGGVYSDPFGGLADFQSRL
jgi:hypothetical protein